jgi:hypothetical protein
MGDQRRTLSPVVSLIIRLQPAHERLDVVTDKRGVRAAGRQLSVPAEIENRASSVIARFHDIDSMIVADHLR